MIGRSGQRGYCQVLVLDEEEQHRGEVARFCDVHGREREARVCVLTW